MMDVEEPTSTATLPAPTGEPPSSEETAFSTTPRTFVRTITSFQDPAGWLSAETLSAPPGSRDEQPPGDDGQPASLPLSAPPGRRKAEDVPDPSADSEKYILAVQRPNQLSEHCHVKGWIARHTHAKASSRMPLAGGPAYSLRSQHAIPTVLKSRRHTRHPWARDTWVFLCRHAGWWTCGLLRAVLCTCVMSVLTLLCQPGKLQTQPANSSLHASPRVPRWVLFGLLLMCNTCPVASHRQTGPEAQQPYIGVPMIREHTAKRNLRKAAYRAARSETQCATYRGTTYSADSLRQMAGLPTATMCEPRRTRQGQGRDPTVSARPRLSVMTWNAGGLPKDAWMEFQLWLHEQRDYDVIMVQETHWRFSSQFKLPQYHALHSGTTDHRHQGCLTLIHKRCCKAEDIRWAPTVGGHLLHVRIPYKRKHIDLVNLYQHCWGASSSVEHLTEKRDKLWYRVQSLLSEVPIRNTLIVGGDFNTPCLPQGDCAGPGVTTSKHPPPDQGQFQHLLMVLRLQALNTWGKKSRSFTFENGEAKTQIDFVLMRCAQADSVARQARVLYDFPVLKWRFGPVHHPIACSVPMLMYQHTSGRPSCPKPAPLANQRSEASIDRFRLELSSAIPAGSPVTAERLNSALLEASRHLDTVPLEEGKRAIDDLRDEVKHMWQARQRMLSVLPTKPVAHASDLLSDQHRTTDLAIPHVSTSMDTMQGIFTAWRHLASYLRLHKVFRKRGRERKRELFGETLEAAVLAENNGDKQSLYKAIRQLAPRVPRVRTQVRGSGGQLLSQEEENQEFMAYCAGLFAPDDCQAPAQTQMTGASQPFTETELAAALQGLASRKAVPSHAASVQSWKIGAATVVPALASICERIWSGEEPIPRLWSDSWLVWLPKPGKPANKPSELRPISLTEAGGKVFAKAINNRIRPLVSEAAALWPQFAYLSGRSIDHAIARVVAHCSRVRDTVASARVSLRERRETGRKPTACSGGVMISIDTSKAFDTIDRRVLLTQLQAAGVDASDVSIIMELHSRIGYHPCRSEEEARVESKRGVRQGCTLAPTLWVLVTIALMRAMQEQCGPHWATECSTLFADDLLIHHEFHTRAELDKFLPNLAKCLAVLEAIGLQVQHTKTQVILAGRGRQFKKWRKCHTRQTKDGPKLVMWTASGRSQQLPIVQSATYLGIKISYGNFEKQTLQHRLAAAEAQRSRLLKILHHKGIPVRKRLQLWVACVRSAALYGLHAVGLGQKQVDRLAMVLTKHVRAIVGSFAHMHKESSRLYWLTGARVGPACVWGTAGPANGLYPRGTRAWAPLFGS